MSQTFFRTGELVAFRRTEFATQPAPGARDIAPTPNGDGYSYFVTQYYCVVANRPGNKLVLRSRHGHEHELSADDPNLRKTNLLEKLFVSRQFAAANRAATDSHRESA